MVRGIRACIVVLVSSIASLFGADAVHAATQRVMTLPTPAGLEADVKFWEKVFSKYRPDQCVFHDREDLSIIYAVKTLPGATPEAQRRMVPRYVDAIRKAMLHLSLGGAPRNLIEKRILAVSPEEAREDRHYFVAAAENVRCQQGVDLLGSIARSRQHVAMIKKVLKDRSLPPDLAYLPHLESGFRTSISSHAGARGLWQLMPATARQAGLKVTRKVDQRIDVRKATVVAARLLSDLHVRTGGSWPLAVTAYNYGPNGISRAIDIYGRDYMRIRENHRTRIFGFAAKNYYPSFLAVRNVASAYENGQLALNEARN